MCVLNNKKLGHIYVQIDQTETQQRYLVLINSGTKHVIYEGAIALKDSAIDYLPRGSTDSVIVRSFSSKDGRSTHDIVKLKVQFGLL